MLCQITYAQVIVEMPKVGDKKFKTKVEKKTQDPLYGEAFTFAGVKGRDCQLSVSVYHKNFLASDNLIGQVTVPREQVYGAPPDVATFPLISPGGLTTGKNVGTVDLKIFST